MTGCNIKKQVVKSIKDNRGVAMLFAMIVAAVVMAFCLSLMLVVYSYYAQSARKLSQDQCKILAQSFSEALKEEFNSEETSELKTYLSSQINSGVWISSAESASVEAGKIKELLLNSNDIKVPGYKIKVALTYYGSSGSDEPVVDDDLPDEDDEDDVFALMKISGMQSYEAAVPLFMDPISEPKSYYIKAKITCIRGDENDRDLQIYTVESVYPSVML